MFKSQLENLQMPKFVPKPIDPPDKENDMYPLKWPSYGSMQSSRPKSQTRQQKVQSLEQDLRELVPVVKGRHKELMLRVRDDPLLDNELLMLQQQRENMAKLKSDVVTKPKLGSLNFLSEDLKQLMQEKDESGFDNGDDDLPPLLQAITRHHRHDNIQQKLEQQMAALQEKERERVKAETSVS
nr:hypothetical protein BaRGS_027920 [Batillaria attramentaria]